MGQVRSSTRTVSDLDNEPPYGGGAEIKLHYGWFTGANAGYCFVDFVSNAAAVKALNTVNGTPIPGTNRLFKLNWASGGGLN
ncbi:unnamed protein product [Rhizophagus irregularis]|nr:unnamed protein product [Rhizophagus irregularis]